VKLELWPDTPGPTRGASRRKI